MANREIALQAARAYYMEHPVVRRAEGGHRYDQAFNNSDVEALANRIEQAARSMAGELVEAADTFLKTAEYGGMDSEGRHDIRANAEAHLHLRNALAAFREGEK